MSIAASILPAEVEWEVIVVDNNSTDQTCEAVASVRSRFANRFRYVFEPTQGLSHARNTGIREAHGDIIAFTDDDVTVDPHWLSNLTLGLIDESYAGAGGRVLPVWNGAPPRWLPLDGRYALAPLAAFDLAHADEELREPAIGANMAFKRRVFETYGRFRADLGRSANVLLSGEDCEFGSRLLSAGERLRYEPSAIVYHPVARERLQQKYFLAWWFGKGRADIRISGISPEARYRCLGIPLYLFRNLAVWAAKWMLTADPAIRFDRKTKVWGRAGQIAECYAQARRGTVAVSPAADRSEYAYDTRHDSSSKG